MSRWSVLVPEQRQGPQWKKSGSTITLKAEEVSALHSFSLSLWLMSWKKKIVFLDLPSLPHHHEKADNNASSCLICRCPSSVFVFIGLGHWFELRRWGWVGSSLVPACQHALIWMFLFYFVCLFVCVCILCSVVYQDGFYGADIYVSIIY